MPAPFERYNRFMKFLSVGWSNDKKLDEGNGWTNADWLSTCEVCKQRIMRSLMKLQDGLVKCEGCRGAI